MPPSTCDFSTTTLAETLEPSIEVGLMPLVGSGFEEEQPEPDFDERI
jgi:hypothetical protein